MLLMHGEMPDECIIYGNIEELIGKSLNGKTNDVNQGNRTA